MKHKVHAINIQKFSSYLKENTARLHYKGQLVMFLREVMAVYYENHMKYINKCGQSTGLLNDRAGGKKGYPSFKEVKR